MTWGERFVNLYDRLVQAIAAGAAVLALMHASNAPALQGPDVTTVLVVVQQIEPPTAEQYAPKDDDVVEGEIVGQDAAD